MKMHVKKDDQVVILSGNDKGKKGKVLEVSPKEGKVIVEGCHIVTKHVKARRPGDPSGIIKAEGAMYASKVQVIWPHCKKATRIAYKTFADKTKSRVCKHCGETL